ncbi:hypothetical protein BJ742DRAFT_769641 [Cladochytrium replicatum]|nr:hypothetical protein BJ742DRAFT_769641 [Cladochytrium replicatum]
MITVDAGGNSQIMITVDAGGNREGIDPSTWKFAGWDQKETCNRMDAAEDQEESYQQWCNCVRSVARQANKVVAGSITELVILAQLIAGLPDQLRVTFGATSHALPTAEKTLDKVEDLTVIPSRNVNNIRTDRPTRIY